MKLEYKKSILQNICLILTLAIFCFIWCEFSGGYSPCGLVDDQFIQKFYEAYGFRGQAEFEGVRMCSWGKDKCIFFSDSDRLMIDLGKNANNNYFLTVCVRSPEPESLYKVEEHYDNASIRKTNQILDTAIFANRSKQLKEKIQAKVDYLSLGLVR